MPRTVDTEDLLQLRLLSMKLLKQLRAGQDAVRRSVAKAFSESGLNSSTSYYSETPVLPETSLVSLQACCSQDTCHIWDPLDAHRDNPCDVAWPDSVSSRVPSQPPVNCQHLELLGQPRSHSAPSPTTVASKKPAPSAGLCDQAPGAILTEQSEQSKSKVTYQEPATPESNWSLQPFLGCDWVVDAVPTPESLDSGSSITSKPEAFFSTLQKFRETNQEECKSQILGLCDGSDVEEDHECVFCYRVNRRLFLVPLDPGVSCRLCGIPRDQQGPRTLVEHTQVRVSVPMSILDPPHRYRIHRRKSFDASDTLALPRHCLLGWDILPPKSEKSIAPKSLDLWSSVSKAQCQELSVCSSSCLALPVQVPLPAPVWSEPQVTCPHVPRQKP